MKDYESLKRIWEAEIPGSESHACFCVGPQNGEPMCPCKMRHERSVKTSEYLRGFEDGRKPAKKETPND